jgi:hypothetical protein
MINVATGPNSSEMSHHSSPLRPFDCARPAFMSDSVPQPTKKAGDRQNLNYVRE